MLHNVKRVLVVEPHADDLVIGCSGTLAKLKEENNVEIFSILLSPSPAIYRKIKGVAGSYEEYSWDKRYQELLEAMQILGFDDIDIPFLDKSSEVHHRLDMMPQADLISILEKKVAKCKPDLVFIPEMSYNQDHRAIYNAFQTVARPHFYNGIVLAYETTMEKDFEPTLIVPLTTEQMEKKINACSCYETQLGTDCHLFSLPTMHVAAQYRGRLAYANYAEAFRVVRGVY